MSVANDLLQMVLLTGFFRGNSILVFEANVNFGDAKGIRSFFLLSYLEALSAPRRRMVQVNFGLFVSALEYRTYEMALVRLGREDQLETPPQAT